MAFYITLVHSIIRIKPVSDSPLYIYEANQMTANPLCPSPESKSGKELDILVC